MKCHIHNDVEAVGTCTACGKALCQECARTVDGKLMCNDCWQRVAGHTGSPVAADRKDPILALILGLIGGVITGSLLFSLGQLYNGQVKKFIALTVLNACIGFVCVVLYLLGSIVTLGIGLCCCLPLFLLPLVLYLYELYDAYDTADRMRRGVSLPDWFE